MNVKDYVIQELESYPRTLRQIAVLRYELEHPVQVSTEEMLDAMAFARGEHFGSAPGHVSDKTLYIAMNYRQKANEVNAEISGEISAKLLELEHKKNRIEYYVGMLDSRHCDRRQMWRRNLFRPWDIAESMSMIFAHSDFSIA